MTKTSFWRRYTSVWGRNPERDVNEELDFHFEMRKEELMRRGYSAESAEVEARREFGNVERIRLEMRRIDDRQHARERRGMWLEELAQDVRYALRSLRKDHGFALAAILSLGIGMGANATIFTLVNAVLFSPLPFPDASELHVVWNEYQEKGLERVTLAPAEVRDLMTQTTASASWAALSYRELNLGGAAQPEHLAGLDVTPSFFETLGVKARLGRTFTEADVTQPVAIISDELWRRQFGSAPSVIGRSMQLDGRAVTIIGVLSPRFEIPNPDGFMLPHPPQVWTPLNLAAMAEMNRGEKFLRVIARIPAGSSAQVHAQLQSLTASLRSDYANFYPSTWQFSSVPLQEQTIANVRSGLQLLLTVISLVFLIALMNVGNLVIARSVTRRQELAMRRALGASAGRIVRQLVTENAVIAACGGAMAIGITMWAISLLSKAHVAAIPRLAEVSMSGRVWLAIAIATTATAIVLSLLALSGARITGISAVLRGSARTMSGAHGRIRSILVMVEIALATVVLVAGSLMMASLLRLTALDTGINADDVTAMSVSLPEARYADVAARARAYDRIVERVSALPGVTGAAVINPLPYSGESWQGSFAPEGVIRNADQQSQSAEYGAVTPGYFDVMGIRLLHGRTFSNADRVGAQSVVVDEYLARTQWGQANAVGRRLHVGGTEAGTFATVIGVVNNVATSGVAETQRPHIYLSNNDRARTSATLVVRRARGSSSEDRDVVAAVHELDGDLPLGSPVSMKSVLNSSFGTRRYAAALLTALGFIALGLVAVGLYALISYFVTERTRELGIRIALGSTGRGVVMLVLRQGVLICGLGLAAGLVASFALRRVLANLLFGITTSDPGAFVVVAFVLTLIAGLACWLPARRAAGVQPMTALRMD